MPLARRDLIRTLAAPLAQPAGQLRRRPNVLLIMADDLGYGDLSVHGNRQLKTPAIDRLAAQSIEFTRFYVSPVCAPTRASLLTGRYSLRTGVHGVSAGRQTLPANEATIARALRLSGYHNALYGKWHLGDHYPNVPHAQGFNEFVGFRAGGLPTLQDARLESNGQPYPTRGHTTDVLTDLASAFLDRRPDPFFLFVSYNVPFSVREAQPAYDLIAGLDRGVGRLMAKLEDLKLADDTIVIFLSDNGRPGDRYNAGLRDGKASVYEGGNRVPFFIRWPGHFEAGRKVETMAAHIDLYPTLLELCRAPQPDHSPPIDGRSLVPLLTSAPARWPDRMLFFHYEGWDDPAAHFPGAVRTQRFNLVNGAELYDLVADPGERNNVAAQFPEEVARLRRAYSAWFRSVVPKGGFTRQPIPVGWAEENPVELTATEGYPLANVRISFDDGMVDGGFSNWKAVGDSVYWNIDAAGAGRYAVSLRYRCGRGGATLEARYGGRALSVLVPDSNGEWRVVDLGMLEFSRGPARLEVRLAKPGAVSLAVEKIWVNRS